jgi:hypothetical protein
MTTYSHRFRWALWTFLLLFIALILVCVSDGGDAALYEHKAYISVFGVRKHYGSWHHLALGIVATAAAAIAALIESPIMQGSDGTNVDPWVAGFSTLFSAAADALGIVFLALNTGTLDWAVVSLLFFVTVTAQVYLFVASASFAGKRKIDPLARGVAGGLSVVPWLVVMLNGIRYWHHHNAILLSTDQDDSRGLDDKDHRQILAAMLVVACGLALRNFAWVFGFLNIGNGNSGGLYGKVQNDAGPVGVTTRSIPDQTRDSFSTASAARTARMTTLAIYSAWLVFGIVFASLYGAEIARVGRGDDTTTGDDKLDYNVYGHISWNVGTFGVPTQMNRKWYAFTLVVTVALVYGLIACLIAAGFFDAMTKMFAEALHIDGTSMGRAFLNSISTAAVFMTLSSLVGADDVMELLLGAIIIITSTTVSSSIKVKKTESAEDASIVLSRLFFFAASVWPYIVPMWKASSDANTIYRGFEDHGTVSGILYGFFAAHLAVCVVNFLVMTRWISVPDGNTAFRFEQFITVATHLANLSTVITIFAGNYLMSREKVEGIIDEVNTFKADQLLP